MRHIESRIQIDCVRWFRLQYPQIARMLFAVPNGGARNKISAQILKAEGVVAGVADLILLVPSRGYSSLCIEMKTGSKSSRQSDNQKLWQVAAEKAGNKYVICRNFPDFEHEIKDYINFAKLKEK